MPSVTGATPAGWTRSPGPGPGRGSSNVARRTSRTARRTAAFVVAAAAILAVVRPWTVRPLVAPVTAFDASDYAGQAWPRIVEEASRTALDLAKGLQAPAGLDRVARTRAAVGVRHVDGHARRRSIAARAWAWLA